MKNTKPKFRLEEKNYIPLKKRENMKDNGEKRTEKDITETTVKREGGERKNKMKKVEPFFWGFLIVVAVMTVIAVKVAYGF